MNRDDTRGRDSEGADIASRRFESGTVIAGKYRVERVIGQGGMGIVLAARHLGLDEMVAVKLIREERAEGAEALARFQREARAAARIKSEHVARVLDVDRLPEGEPYIVMELIDGTDLHALVKRRGPLPPEEAATYIVQACEGLAEAHALGMVHRDLKLKNLFLTKRRDGRPLIKVIDFGVVKLALAPNDPEVTGEMPGRAATARRHAVAHEATLTGAAMLVGSVHYMAPEQIRASNVVDARADVWSLGVCLYSLLTGELPFDGASVVAICSAIQGRPAPDVRTRAPGVPAGLAQAIARALEKDLRRRLSSVGELALAIQSFGTDDAAASRIETILRSNPARPSPFSSHADSAERAGTADDSGATATMAHGIGTPIARARVESTIDAAAVGLRLSGAPEAPPRQRGRLGVAVLVAAAGATLAIGIRTRSAPAIASESAAPPITTPTATPAPAFSGSDAADPTTNAVTATTPPPSPVATTSSAAPSGRSPAKRSPNRPAKAAPATARSATTAAPPPKGDPPGAYDHF